jgi:hypothetical protein
MRATQVTKTQFLQKNVVITRLVRVIHFSSLGKRKLDCPDKPGNDEF